MRDGINVILVIVIIFVIYKFKFSVKKIVKPKQSGTKLSSKNMTKEEFKEFLGPSVKAISEKTGIPYAFLMAQIALETGWGKSELFYKYNNVGGIRSFHPERENSKIYWTVEHVKDPSKFPNRNKAKDKPLGNGYTSISVELPFRIYPDLVTGLQAYLDNVLLNKNFKGYINMANGDPNKYAELIQSGKLTGAKYATDVAYVGKIKSLIKQFA